MTTTTVNLRDMPEGLVRRAKARAALNGRSLKAFVIDVLEAAVSADPGGSDEDGKVSEKGKKKERKKKNKKHKKKEKKSND